MLHSTPNHDNISREQLVWYYKGISGRDFAYAIKNSILILVVSFIGIIPYWFV